MRPLEEISYLALRLATSTALLLLLDPVMFVGLPPWLPR